MRIVLFFLLFITLNLTSLPLQARDLQEMETAIAAYERSKICPPPGEGRTWEFKDYCKKLCDIKKSCNGTDQTDPCETGDKAACHALTANINTCLTEMNRINNVTLAYNRIVAGCQR